MSGSKKRVFLTGASGYMGRAGLDVFLARQDRFEVVALVPPTPRDRQIMAPYQKRGIEVIWGDLTRYEDVLEGVAGADIVLHVGGMVSPLADAHPALTLKVNVGAAVNLVRAVRAQPDPDQVFLVYIGTVAQTGNRPPPIHWGRIGDPIKISFFDTYALSKIIAERTIVDSGLRNWVSLRQTGIARMAAADSLDPVLFHAPLQGVLEWVTARDSGMLLANVCEEAVPRAFWGRIYNIGGGQPNRITNFEYFEKVLRVAGIQDLRRILEVNWFALRNFHGQWFSDSDALEEIVPFRTQTLDAYLAEEAAGAAWYTPLASVFPGLVHRKFQRVAQGPGGTFHWLTHGDEPRIEAFFGSRTRWAAIGDWAKAALARPSETPLTLEHGYDERKARADFCLADAQGVASFRGGECLEKDIPRGDWTFPLRWRCHAGHEFSASLNLIAMGGHWCPVCTADPAAYPEMALHSPFFKQVFAPDLPIVQE